MVLFIVIHCEDMSSSSSLQWICKEQSSQEISFSNKKQDRDQAQDIHFYLGRNVVWEPIQTFIQTLPGRRASALNIPKEFTKFKEHDTNNKKFSLFQRLEFHFSQGFMLFQKYKWNIQKNHFSDSPSPDCSLETQYVTQPKGVNCSLY